MKIEPSDGAKGGYPDIQPKKDRVTSIAAERLEAYSSALLPGSPSSSSPSTSVSPSVRFSPSELEGGVREHNLLVRMRELVKFAAKIERMDIAESIKRLLLLPLGGAMLATASDHGFQHIDWIPYDSGDAFPLDSDNNLIWGEMVAELKHLIKLADSCTFVGRPPSRATLRADSALTSRDYQRAQIEMLKLVPDSCWQALCEECAELDSTLWSANDLRENAAYALSYDALKGATIRLAADAWELLPSDQQWQNDVNRIFDFNNLLHVPVAEMETTLYNIIRDLQPTADELSEAFANLIEQQLNHQPMLSLTTSMMSYFTESSTLKPFMALDPKDGLPKIVCIDIRLRANPDTDPLRKFIDYRQVPFAGEQSQLFASQMKAWGHKLMYALLHNSLLVRKTVVAPSKQSLAKLAEMLNAILPSVWLEEFTETVLDRKGSKGNNDTILYLNALFPKTDGEKDEPLAAFESMRRLAFSYMTKDLQQVIDSVHERDRDLFYAIIHDIAQITSGSVTDVPPITLLALTKVFDQNLKRWNNLSSIERLAACIQCIGIFHVLTGDIYGASLEDLYRREYALEGSLQTALTLDDPTLNAATTLAAFADDMAPKDNLKPVLREVVRLIRDWVSVLEQLIEQPNNEHLLQEEQQAERALRLTVTNAQIFSEASTLRKSATLGGALNDLATALAARRQMHNLTSEGIESLLWPFRELAQDTRFFIVASIAARRWGALPTLSLLKDRELVMMQRDWEPEPLPQSKTLVAINLVTKAQEEINNISTRDDALAYSRWVHNFLKNLLGGTPLTPLTHVPEFSSGTDWEAARHAGILLAGTINPLPIPKSFEGLINGVITSRMKKLSSSVFFKPKHFHPPWLQECVQELAMLLKVNRPAYQAALQSVAPWYVKHSYADLMLSALLSNSEAHSPLKDIAPKILHDLAALLAQYGGAKHNPLVSYVRDNK